MTLLRPRPRPRLSSDEVSVTWLRPETRNEPDDDFTDSEPDEEVRDAARALHAVLIRVARDRGPETTRVLLLEAEQLLDEFAGLDCDDDAARRDFLRDVDQRLDEILRWERRR